MLEETTIRFRQWCDHSFGLRWQPLAVEMPADNRIVWTVYIERDEMDYLKRCEFDLHLFFGAGVSVIVNPVSAVTAKIGVILTEKHGRVTGMAVEAGELQDRGREWKARNPVRLGGGQGA